MAISDKNGAVEPEREFPTLAVHSLETVLSSSGAAVRCGV